MFNRMILGATSLAALFATSALAQVELQPGETLADDQTFTYRILDELKTLDPGMVEDVDGNDVARGLFEGLYNHDAEGNVIPGVALSHTMSDDGLTYTFALRPEARWSNGDPVTANDFVYAWRRAASPELGSEYAWFISLMGVANADAVIAGEMPTDQLGVRAVDDQTLEVTLTQALPHFPQMLVTSVTFPVHQGNVEEFGDAWVQPGNMVSNGPYTLSEYVASERLEMTRNPQYWDDANTTIDAVTVLVINDENQALTRYLAGEMDRTHVPAGQYPRLVAEYPTETLSFPELCTYYYGVNMSETGVPALQEPAVREALSLAIDRDIIVENVVAGGQVPAYTLTHWATAGWEVPPVPAVGMTQEERNARAKELMAEAGYGEGGEPLTVEILYNTSEAHDSIAVAVSQMWKQTLGVETTLANQEWQTFLDTRGEQNYEVARGAWCADYNEPSTFLDIMTTESGYNDSKYSNERVDAAMAEARLAADPLPLYQEVETIISTDLPIIPIYFYAGVYMLNDAIKGWPVENAQQTWYARDLYKIAE